MPDKQKYSPQIYQVPTYALVIGISKYLHGTDKELLGENEFPHLKYAAEDARKFADFLKNYGVINYNVTCLLDDEADNERIIEELDKLRLNCKSLQQKPLIILFFSGHGWVDNEDRHYLITYKSERNKLVSTALPHETLQITLNGLTTDKMVVFIDACHSGAIAVADAKGAFKYNPESLGSGQGRYIISSCTAGQKSWEWKERQGGIFTSHLLELLKCETDDIQEEKIDIEKLVPVLRNKVRKTANELYHEEQDVVGNVQGGQGIILAINQKLIEKKETESEEKIEKKRQFKNRIEPFINNIEPARNLLMIGALELYFETGKIPSRYELFLQTFDQCADSYLDTVEDTIIESWCNNLVRIYKSIIPPSSGNQDKKNRPVAVDEIPLKDKSDSQVSKPSIDSMEKNPGNPALIQNKPPKDETPVNVTLRVFNEEQRRNILCELDKHAKYLDQSIKIDKWLKKGETPQSFVQKMRGIIGDFERDSSEADYDYFVKVCTKVSQQFDNEWMMAEEVKPGNSMALLASQKQRDDGQ
jgi:hypothetical protein